jgi:hypothetical protein
MAAGASALNFALILSGILLRLTPERAPRTVLRYEKPENLGFYACLVTTNVGSFTFVIEKLFSSAPLKVNSIQNGRPIRTKIQTSTIDMKNTTKYCFILYIMMSGDVHYNRYFRLMYSEKTNQRRLASDHNKNDCHIWPKYGIPLLLWLYISSASSDRKSHTVMLSGYSLQVQM